MRLAALAVSLSLSACVTAPAPDQVRAPQPAKAVDLERFYSGRWLEIARLPMGLTDGCVAGATNYVLVSPSRVDVRDTCQVGTPQGREKAIGARGEILDPGTNARLRVRYFGGLVTWDYWVLDHADDYSWFISADPSFDKLWIYTRRVPDDAERQRLVARAGALGYDVRRLEFPAF
ncbi:MULTISPECIES: lipocalin family protein [unclassified Brevundimonas]|uniref:lipocalin family protein n=1 Tax=unclassified Brevundimonas TaxID=2622653 RepID=UPI0006FC2BEA|nr:MULTISPECIES: lipocalin family protein [unclassified Brevundimonas]KQY80124.1 lipocalin [Brevundimonas sp. Root1423]KRA28329.1 lipocalin [Brevundimonas sp. Root608]